MIQYAKRKIIGSALRCVGLLWVAIGGFCAYGCAAPPAMMVTAGASAAQTGISSFVNRELVAVVAHPLPEVYAAALVAGQDLGFTVLDAQLGEARGLVTLVESDGTRTSVRLIRQTEKVSTIKVRVGTLGDRLLSALILRRIQLRLQATGDVSMEIGGG